MLLEYEVLISSSIQRKKPWSKLKWIGIQKESICLMDKKRISILYVPSGRTRRNIGPLKPYLKEVLCFATSRSGEYVIGLLSSGVIIRWHIDSRSVHLIPSYPSFTLSYGKDGSKVNMYISDDGQKIIVLLDLQKLHVWEQTNINNEGEWSLVDINLDNFKSLQYSESAVDATFFSNMIQGDCCLCTIICSSGYSLGVGCLFLQWNEQMNMQPHSLSFTSSVSYHDIPLVKLNPECKPIRLRGAYVSCLSHDSQVLAVAVNQRQPYQSNIVFIDPFTKSIVSTHLKGMGTQNRNVLAKFAKTYWIADLAWSHDDLFVICISRRGHVFVVSKLGEILHVKTHGQSVEFGPCLFIPLHPLFEHNKKHGKPQTHVVQQSHQHSTPRPGSPNSLASTVVSEKSQHQRYSVTTHPRLPIILCCDGYMVTAMQMVNVVRLSDVVTIILAEANGSVRNIIKDFDLKVPSNLIPRFELPAGMLNPAKLKEHRLALLYSSFKSKFKKKKEVKINENNEKSGTGSFIRDEEISMLKYRFEEEDSKAQSEDEVEDKENYQSPTGAILNADEGKIMFDEPTTINVSSDGWLHGTRPVCGELLLSELSKCVDKILSAWGLLTTQSRSDYLVGDGKTISDELQRFFVQTVKTVCDVIAKSQQLSHCLAWNLYTTEDIGTQFNLQSLLCDLTTTLADQFTNLTSFDVTLRPVHVQALKVLLDAVLSSHRTAAEGCTSPKDISENLNLALKFLFKAEQYLFDVNSLQSVSHHQLIGEKYYHQLNIKDSPYTIQTLFTQHLMLPSLWKHFYFALVKCYETETYQQINSLVVRLLSIVQPIVIPRLKLAGNLTTRDETTLHSMHMNLCKYKLDQSLNLAICVLRDNLTSASKWEEMNWAVVELLSSIMVSYFTNQPIIFSSIDGHKRFNIMERNLITSAIRSLKLSYIWTADCAINFLLCCGRIFEAATFASDVGDWKSAVAIQATADKVRAQTYHKSSVFEYKKNSVFDILKNKVKTLVAYTDTDELEFLSNLVLSEPEVITFTQLTQCNPEKLYPYFVDIFTVSVMTGCDLTTWFSKFLWNRLKIICSNLDFLVPESLYLPSPPLYLPLPAPNETEYENRDQFMRHKISTLIQTVLVFFNSINLTENAVSWYVNQLGKSVQNKGRSPLSTLSQSLPSCESKVFESRECKVLLSLFHNLLALLWMFHVQENISLCARNYQKLREGQEFYDDEIRKCLYWINKFVPFSKFLNCEDKMNDLILCLCSSLPVDQFLVNTLAVYFYDPSSISSKIESRFNEMMKKLKESNYVTDDSQQSTGTLQPMSVIYNERCHFYAKKSKKHKLQHIFVNENGSETQKKLKLFFSDSFHFDKDPIFHNFAHQIFEVVLSKAANVSKKTLKGNQSDQSSLDNKIIVLSNRHSIALNELELASQLQNVHQQRFLSRIGEDQILQYSASKSSVGMIEILSTSPRQYFSQPENHLTHDDDASDVNEELNFDFPNLDISETPSHMQKRLLRLSPYMVWLQFWMEKPFSQSQFLFHKPSIRIQLTKCQLLQGLVIAESRFSGRMFSQTGSIISNSAQHETSQMVGKGVPSVSSISAESVSLAEKSNVVISDIGTNHLLSSTPTPEETLRPQHIPPDLSDVAETISEISTEKLVEAEKREIIKRTEKGNQEDENKEGEGSGECSEVVDGGGKIRPKIPVESQTNVDIANTVRSEINNVLLAQQVSLLSQILLGQTLGHLPTHDISPPHNNLVSEALQSFLPHIPPQNQANPPQKEKFLESDTTLPKTTFIQNESAVLTHTESQPEVYTLPEELNFRRKKSFALPLFHVEGITKSQKDVKLVKTPHSIRGWNASVASKETRTDFTASSAKHVQKLLNPNTVDKPLLITDLCTKKDISIPKIEIHGNRLPLPSQGILKNTSQSHIQNNPASRLLKNPSGQQNKHAYKSRKPRPGASFNISQQSNTKPTPYQMTSNVGENSTNYSTKFPILQKPPKLTCDLPNFQHVQRKTIHDVPRFSRVQTPPNLYPTQPPHQLIPRLIDPIEVLAYEDKKLQKFQQVKAFLKVKSTQPPVPIMKISTPVLEKYLTGSKEPDKENVDPKLNNVVHEKIQPSVIRKSPVIAVPKEKTKELPPFEGYLSQEEVSREVQLKNMGCDSSETMSQASAHYLAAVGKQVEERPRMKDAQSQVVIADPPDHDSSPSTADEDYRDKLRAKSIKPPPDVFLKLRSELNNLHTKNEGKEIPSGFLHVGDISMEAVMQEVIDQPITSGDLHYKAVVKQRPEVTPFVVGFEGKVVKPMLNQHIEDMNKVKEVCEVSRCRWTSAMDQMSAQLDVMNAMACKMDQDFKSSVQLVKVIDTIGEALAPTDVKISLPTKERSLSPINEYSDRLEEDLNFTSQLQAKYKAFEPSEEWTNQRTGRKNDHYKERLQEAYKLSSYDFDNKELSRLSTTSSSSKESDVVTKGVDVVKIDDTVNERSNDDDEEMFETPFSHPHSNKSEINRIKSKETTSKHNAHIKQIMNGEEQPMMMKGWKLRTAKEKEGVRRWMEAKRKQRTVEYQRGIVRLRSHEKQPFQQSTTTTNSQLKATIKKREQERRNLQSSNAAIRMDQSIKLMQELKIDRKNLKEEKSRYAQVSPKRYKQSPLKEANRSLNTNYKLHKSSTPYNKKQMKSSLRKTLVEKTSTISTASSVEYPSDASILSTWKLSDNLRHILYGSVDVTKTKKQPRNHVTFESGSYTWSRNSSSDSSSNTDSLLGDVNWSDVDMMVASVDS